MFRKCNKADVDRIVSFKGNSSMFRGDNKKNNIPELQTQGVISICKILRKRDFAYLADEVGMGKTYQALGVISMLLHEKPGAKILIITPGKNVQDNWMDEICRFKDNNLRDTTIKLKEKSYDRPIEFMEYCKKIKDCKKRKDCKQKKDIENNTNIYVLRLTSFSTVAANLVGAEEAKERRFRKSTLQNRLKERGFGRKINLDNESFDSAKAGCFCGLSFNRFLPEFDLVVIDEAQNIRNENNATVFLNAWLGFKRFEISGKPKPKLEPKAKKVLLMSATPAHRDINTLINQIRYFDKDTSINKETIDHDYLKSFLIRRLRTYSGDNKYVCRKNIVEDVSRDINIEQRLFLALIQKKLSDFKGNINTEFKIGFLESFESFDVSAPNGEIRDEGQSENEDVKEFENGNSHVKGEFGQAVDKAILQKVAKSFANSLGGAKFPPHPKLDYMSRAIKESLSSSDINEFNYPDKAIVFVRRIASVNELNKRLGKAYEERIVDYWIEKLNLDPKKRLSGIQSWFENKYNRAVGNSWISEDFDDTDLEIIDEDKDKRWKSSLMKWIAIERNDKKRFSAVSRFRKSLQRNKSNYDFFEENYLKSYYKNGVDSDNCEEAYHNYLKALINEEYLKELNAYVSADIDKYRKKGKNGKKQINRSNLMHLCCYIALKQIGAKEAIFIKQYYGVNDQQNADSNCINKSDEITKTEVINILERDSIWNTILENSEYCYPGSCKVYEDFVKREYLKKCVQKYLTVSEAVLELLYCYCVGDNKHRKDRTKSALKEFRTRIWNDNNGICLRIKQLLEKDNYDRVYNQLFSNKGKNESVTYDTEKMDFMNDQSWVVSAVGGGNNAALIKRFNTPFYPDIIVCTDVLKEGINLHLFCNKVYHYGLAWTPGDLEQRVGRVDRFFSRTYCAREKGNDMKVNIIYPYMGRTIDEQQLKKVLQFKVTIDPLLDSPVTKNIDISHFNSSSVEELAESNPEDISDAPFSGEEFWK